MGGNVEDATYLAFCHQTLLKFSKQNKNEKGNNTESSCTTIHPHSNQKEEKWKGYLFIYLFKKKTNQAGNPTLKIYANCVEESARNQRLISSLKWIMNQLQM